MPRRPYEIDLSFESFNDAVFRDASSQSLSTASFPNSHLSLSIEISYAHSSHHSSFERPTIDLPQEVAYGESDRSEGSEGDEGGSGRHGSEFHLEEDSLEVEIVEGDFEEEEPHMEESHSDQSESF